MDKAKAAVGDFLHRSGHHDTTVHEKVAPAIVNENVTKHRHEEATTAIDREVHQDHYHTSVQPIQDREVLPEEHHHNLIPVEHREHHHGDEAKVQARLEQEASRFKNTSAEGRMKETHSVAPVIAGEHVHHHVHEVIQPIVQKETIQPSVVHTTVPVHEVHHNEAKHHAASALPAISMADFKKQGGSLAGREERYDGFEGEPRAVGKALDGSGRQTTAGPHSSNLENKMDPRVDSDMDGSRNMGANTSSTRSPGTGYDSYGTSGPTHSSTAPGTSTSTSKKPGIMDRLNPLKDSDGDGKKGLMD